MSDQETGGKMKLYLASPLGFSPEHDGYRKRITEQLEAQGHTVFDPWEQQEVDQRIRDALSHQDQELKQQALADAAGYAGQINARGVRSCDGLLAVLDGTELDSGTVAELGYAAGLGKPCYGLRTDIRDMGELPGLPVNLQVLHFIQASGGRLFRAIDAIAIQQKV